MAIPKKDDPEKNCETCGKALTRKRFANPWANPARASGG